MFDLESKIIEWSNNLREKSKFTGEDIIELESHLRDEIDSLINKALSPEEAFIIAVKRIGDNNTLSNEYNKVNRDVIWKNLMFYETDNNAGKKLMKDIIILIGLALLAAFSVKIPEFFGFNSFYSSKKPQNFYYVKLIGLMILPSITILFYIKNYNNITFKQKILIISSFVMSLILTLIIPIKDPYHTAVLTGLHLPLFLWCITGITYTGKDWNNINHKMNFIRLSGETFIYGVLLFCGNFVLWIFTYLIFKQFDIDIEKFYLSNIWLPLIFAIPVIAVYLVESKKSIVENIAPILAKIFSPLFLITMLVFLLMIFIYQMNPSKDRDFLISFNFMLIMVTSLVTYVISARKNIEEINYFDYINIAIIIAAIIIDIVALYAILERITSYGFSANKTAALGENLILLANLSGLSYYYIKFFLKKCKFISIEKWQTSFLYVILFWCLIVSFIFPIIFSFK